MKRASTTTLLLVSIAWGCAPGRDPRDGADFSPGLSGAGSDGGSAGAKDSEGGGGSGGGGSGRRPGDEAIYVDVGAGEDQVPPGSGGEQGGCKKVDFLFVVDNSASMINEQISLNTSFPGFIKAIRDVTKINDFNLMVVDTDAAGGGSCGVSTTIINGTTYRNCTGGTKGCCCKTYCSTRPTSKCDGVVCQEWNDKFSQPQPPVEPCDGILGAGLTKSSAGAPCGVAGGIRYMTAAQPDLEATFGCLIQAGDQGDNDERQMAALLEAVGSQTAPGACNTGFVRPDAVLVVTLITDEEDDPADPMGVDSDTNSPGGPVDWKNALIAAKGGDETALVFLGLIGDTTLPGAVCGPIDAEKRGAEPSPRLQTLSDSFVHGSWAPICNPDYSSFFEQAVGVIDQACQMFQPPR